MAISRTLVVSLEQDRANPEEKMFIYRGDVGVDIYIELSNLTYQFNNKKIIIGMLMLYSELLVGLYIK